MTKVSKICLRLYSVGILCKLQLVKFLLYASSSTRVAWCLYHYHKKPPLNCCQSSEGIHQGRSMNSIIRVRWSVLSTMPVCLLRRFPIHSYCSYPFQATYNDGGNCGHKNDTYAQLIQDILPVHYCLSPGFLGSFNSLILALTRHLFRLHCITKLKVTTNRVVAHQM